MGMITEDLLTLSLADLNNLNDTALRKVVSTMRSTARKRYERLQKGGLDSMVNTYFKKGAKNTEELLPTVKGMDRITLLNEYARYSRFLSAKSSTVKGARQVLKQQKQFIKQETDREFNVEETLRFFDLYELAKKLEVGRVLDYNVVRDIVAEVYDKNMRKSNKTILSEVEERLQTYYENEFGTPGTTTSEFFE